MIIVIRACVSVMLLALSIWIMVGNLLIVSCWYTKKQKETMIPFLGGILGAAGIALFPLPILSRFFWIPLVADPGCGFMLVGVFIEQIRRLFR